MSKILIAVLFLFISHMTLFVVGRIQGFDIGWAAAVEHLDCKMKEAIEDQKTFTLQGIHSIVFYPRKDSGVIVGKRDGN